MHVLRKFLLFQALACFGQNALGSEIINGRQSREKSMLYMASVQSKTGHICGGFLISERYVMTAAHCDKFHPSSVVLGTHDLTQVTDNMIYSVESCKHPSYVDVEHGNDIMLLKLSRKARLSKRVRPIQLPNEQMKLKDNQKCLVAGWGFTQTRGETVEELREVDVPIINLEKCQKEWNNVLPANVTCAGGYGTNKGICQGDSGGPLVCKGEIAVGIVSFNSNEICDYPDVPNVFTDISKFLPWIKNILKTKQCQQ